MGPDGLEPSTHGLKVRCSTDWAIGPTTKQAQMLNYLSICVLSHWLILCHVEGSYPTDIQQIAPHTSLPNNNLSESNAAFRSIRNALLGIPKRAYGSTSMGFWLKSITQLCLLLECVTSHVMCLTTNTSLAKMIFTKDVRDSWRHCLTSYSGWHGISQPVNLVLYRSMGGLE